MEEVEKKEEERIEQKNTRKNQREKKERPKRKPERGSECQEQRHASIDHLFSPSRQTHSLKIENLSSNHLCPFSKVCNFYGERLSCGYLRQRLAPFLGLLLLKSPTYYLADKIFLFYWKYLLGDSPTVRLLSYLLFLLQCYLYLLYYFAVTLLTIFVVLVLFTLFSIIVI